MKIKKKLPKKEALLKWLMSFLFLVWLISMGIFTGFVIYGISHEPNYSELVENTLLNIIIIGVLSYLSLWLLGLISLLAKNLRGFIFRTLTLSIVTAVIWIGLIITVSLLSVKDIPTPQQPIIAVSSEESVEDIPSPPISPSPSPRPTYKPVDPYANDEYLKDAEWGVAVEKDSGSYTMKVGMDPQMSTPNELYEALMVYRNIKGKSRLTWDDRLATYASERASFICQNGSDHHAGFSQYLEAGGYEKLGFRHLGENMSNGMRLSGVHLIEWIYSKSPGHDANQLGPWSHIGVGISGNCSVLIFGDRKM